MARKKKTADVKSLIEWGNKQLARKDEYATKKFKAGIAVMMEKILHESGNYEGFRFLVAGENKIEDESYYDREYTIR